ncbi:MAG TPA: hypothetical protein VJ947_02030, partial [Pseudohaliea sp.]|nr:hypothetical protein [Pseudohaliea sp.]
MERAAYDPDDPEDARGGFPEGTIRAQLERLRHSASFARAHRLLRLLEYLVEHSLAGSDRDLQESIIGIEHFQRGSDFDCQTDTIVRVNARRLRDRLAIYYRDEGSADPIRFEIPKGRYRVVFHPGTQPPASEPVAAPKTPAAGRVPAAQPPPSPGPGARSAIPVGLPRPRLRLGAVAVALFAVAGLALVATGEHGRKQRGGGADPAPAV